MSAAPRASTKECTPASRTSTPPETASTRGTTCCSDTSTCRSAPPPTSKVASRARTPSAGDGVYAGSLGTQVVKIFDLVAARTGLREHEAVTAGFEPFTTDRTFDDHKAYYPGATPLRIRLTGDRRDGRLLGAQLVGHYGAEVSKRVDIYATALFHHMTIDDMADLDLSYTPPLSSPWDPTQMAALHWQLEPK